MAAETFETRILSLHLEHSITNHFSAEVIFVRDGKTLANPTRIPLTEAAYRALYPQWAKHQVSGQFPFDLITVTVTIKEPA